MVGELVFIGLGLHDEFGLSLRGQAEARSCDMLFAEFYTSIMPELNLENLRKIVGNQIQVLSRKEVEEQAEGVILSKAKTCRVGFLVPGDPMVATTHVDLRLRAHKAGIRTRIIHAASVASAVAGVTGLQSYKFGRTVTIPASWQGDLPESVYMGIKNNLTERLHSLVLLEVDVENKRHITIPEALKQLLAVAKRRSENAITTKTLAVGVARLEAPNMTIKAGTASELTHFDFGEPPYALVIPGQLHFIEAEALHVFCDAPKERSAGECMSVTGEDPAERARKYIANFENALQKLSPAKEDSLVRAANIRRVSDTTRRYLQDARYYLENGKPTTSLASIAYAEGLLDALTFLELATSKSTE